MCTPWMTHALVMAARSGDPTAWGAIYDRYADKLHDHCHRILRDRDEAADALHDAFIAAARNLHQLRDPARLRPWLYSICRHMLAPPPQGPGRVDLTDEMDDVSASDGDLDRGVRSEELSELVWAAAAGLNGRDQALLDLNLRQGLEGQDLADAMGTTLNNSYVMLSRLRDQVERSLGALLIARLGRDDCDELDDLLGDWDGKFSPLLRKRVARHVDSCEICSERRKSVGQPAGPARRGAPRARPRLPQGPGHLLAARHRSRRLRRRAGGPSVPFNSVGFAAFDDVGRAAPAGHPRRRRGGLLLLVGGFSLAFTGDDEQPVRDGRLRELHHPRRHPPRHLVLQLQLDVQHDRGLQLDHVAGSSSTTVRPGIATPPPGGGTTTTRPTADHHDDRRRRERPRDHGHRSPGLGRGAGPRTVTVSARITDGNSVESARAQIQTANESHSVALTRDGDIYRATVAGFEDGGNVSVVITASDGSSSQQTGRTFQIPSCAATATSQPSTAPSSTSTSNPE